MANQNRADLSVIDFTVVSQKDAQGQSTAASVEERHRLFTALRDTGFAYLKYPGVDQATVDELFSHSRRFFAKPLEEKAKILGKLDKGRGPSQGYLNPLKIAQNPNTSDMKELFGMYRDDDADKPNQWLSDVDSQAMRADLARFFETCHGVILELLSALAEQIGLSPEVLHPTVSEKNHFIACLHYPGTEPEAIKTRDSAVGHTDYGCMTLLFNHYGEGLQVLGKNGEYEYVPRKENCAVLNVGDLLSQFFNGDLPSTLHRVVEPPVIGTSASAEQIPSRYTIAFFGHFNTEQIVKPLDRPVPVITPAKVEISMWKDKNSARTMATTVTSCEIPAPGFTLSVE